MMPLVNFHSHHPLPSTQVGLISHSIIMPFEPKERQLYSVGLHPYDISSVAPQWLDDLRQAASAAQVGAIGECGIDRGIAVPVNLQLELFTQHIRLAEQLQKPLLIHAVRAYADLLFLKKKHQPLSPWIIHGYQGKLINTKQLVAHDFYFSIGEALLQQKKDWESIVRLIPPARLLVETDASLLSVGEIYRKLADLCGMMVGDLEKQVYQNYKRIVK